MKHRLLSPLALAIGLACAGSASAVELTRGIDTKQFDSKLSACGAFCACEVADTAISVIIPTYNRSESLSRVLNALKEQSLGGRHFEVVVVSDGSTDATVEMIEELVVPFKLVFETQANQGPAVARNRAVELATSPAI